MAALVLLLVSHFASAGSACWSPPGPRTLRFLQAAFCFTGIAGRIEVMSGDTAAAYLAGLRADERAELGRVNGPGLAALHGYLASGEAIAFLGAGVSAPLYPMWDGLIQKLLDATTERLSQEEAATCRVLARQSPEEVVEIVRQSLGAGAYREVLREVLHPQVDPESGRSWTPVQELVCRCAFKAVVTTNYDPGIVDARIRVRPGALATGFTTWEDELGLDRWRTGDVFGEDELPVLFAHGQHNRPDSVVLATTEYRRAYAGKLPQVLARLLDRHLAWIGFSFADQRIAAILREIGDRTGTRIEPGAAPRHVAVLAWDPDAEGNDPGVLARRAEIAYGAQVVLYPAPGGDHSALSLLLAGLADDRFPPVAGLPVSTMPPPDSRADRGPGAVVRWVPGPEAVEHFTGRAEELARLDRWAADKQVSLIAVTAWGGAGKTALVTHWAQGAAAAWRERGIRGVFGWSFYADPSAEHWAQELLKWVRENLGVRDVPFVDAGRSAAAVITVLRAAPVLLVLDGLEVVQEGPAGGGFGRLLDGTLREVLAGICQRTKNPGLVLLTSRFPFADLETFDGSSARMLEVPPFTPAEGSSLMAVAGGDWLPDGERRALARAVDGHALAVGVLAGLLAARPAMGDLVKLRQELVTAARTSARVSRVLSFYADRLSEPDLYLLAAISLFVRPVDAKAALAVAKHPAFGKRLTGWTPSRAQAAVRDHLGGLATWHSDGTISAHPLVRDTFRPLVMAAAEVAAETALTGIPKGKVVNGPDALRVVEAIELLLEAGQWKPADGIYRGRTDNGEVWKHLPAARLGQRAAMSFVATAAHRGACAVHLGPSRASFYLNAAGFYALGTGDLATAREFLLMFISHARANRDLPNLCIGYQNLAVCLGMLGEIDPARKAATGSLIFAESEGIPEQARDSRVFLGWLADLNGDSAEAEEQFTAANRIGFEAGLDSAHLDAGRGVWWAEWLARTGRPRPSRALTKRNAQICRKNRWTVDLARCDRQLGRLALTAGDIEAAGNHLAEAVSCFRDGDYLIELAITLVDMAEHTRAAGDHEAADHHSGEALSIAAPRKLIPVQSAALAARARTRASQAVVLTSTQHLFQGRDAADAALRLATRHHLPWHELDALRAHAVLDQAESIDGGWSTQADALHVQLVPAGLDPDPLATIERLASLRRPRGQ
jgi:tetratricopeptide (TPR) repeat protein